MVVQAAIRALVAVEKNDAIPLILKFGENPLMVKDTIRHLRLLKAAEGLPYLKNIAKNHYYKYTRIKAKKVIEIIEAHNGDTPDDS
jgi:hypothetical protein